MKQTSKSLALLAIALTLAPSARAIELSLEENRAERGSIGYIDMQRLFKTFPETVRAKENFEEVVRQAEEQVNLRKAEILRLRNELSQLKIEREFIARNPVVDVSTSSAGPGTTPAPLAPAPAPAEAPKASPAAPSAPTTPAIPEAKSNPAAILPGMASSDTAKALKKPEPLTINIPGVSTAPIVVQPPQAPIAPAAVPTVSTVAFTPPPAAPAPTKPAEQLSPPLNAALVEIDGKIAVKARELAQKEADFKEQQAAAEKNLLDLEGRKTEILLGKIYKAVQQVARKEGISVVVDKGSILYGHDAVDLTEKTLKFLKGEQP